MMKPTLIFDCDGVLVDSELVSCTAAVIALNQFGISTELAEVQTLIGKSYKEMLEYYQRRDGIKDIYIMIEELLNGTEQNYFSLADQLQPMPGIKDLLEDLIAKQIPLVVASSGGYRKIEFSLEKTGLRKYFPVVCSAVDVPRGKPEPDLFLYAAQKVAAAPSHCIVVEDSLYGIIAGKRANMFTLGLTSSFPEDALHSAGADAVINGFTDFFKVLAEHKIII